MAATAAAAWCAGERWWIAIVTRATYDNVYKCCERSN